MTVFLGKKVHVTTMLVVFYGFYITEQYGIHKNELKLQGMQDASVYT